MRIRFLLLGLFPSLFFAQKETDFLKCYLESLTTVCSENNNKVISEIKSDGGIKIYGRFKDLQRQLSEREFKKYKSKINFNCNEEVKYDNHYGVHYSQEPGDDRKQYFIYDEAQQKIMYRGTEDIRKVKAIDLNSNQKYLQLYNKEKEGDRSYEASYHYYNPQHQLVYSFHQHGNEFDEYTYLYTDSDYSTLLSEVYKNGMLFEEYFYTFEIRIKEHTIDQSYQLDKKNRPILKTTTYPISPNDCNCKEGYVTTIIYRDDSPCDNKIILE